MDAVGNILAERRRDRLPWGPASVLAALLHGAILVAFLLSALARPMHYAAPRAVAVRLLPAGAIRAPAQPETPQPAPPPAAPKPKIEKPPPEEPPKPSKNALLLPAKEDKKKKPTPPPVSRPGPAVSPNVSLPSAGEETTGTASSAAAGAGGTAGIGSLKLDQADFKYPVYIERMVQIISLNWFKPAQAVQTSPIVHFQIERDGTITDPRIVTSSGLPFVDRAALRAVLASSPLPPLPAEYGGPHLGIQVVFE
ncbi:MAG TPA: energy transducer TonB [Thermoanaerobaculia bacterium]|nr:energy transducer TonB [Thermoanaerobaculia bacterium]